MWNQSQGGGFMNNTVSSPRFVEISIALKWWTSGFFSYLHGFVFLS